MALTESTMPKLGLKAPAFDLPDVSSGKKVSLASFDDQKALLVMFICNHCPFVRHVHQELARVGRDYASQSLGIVAINANDVATHPDDSPDKMKQVAAEWGLSFPYCYDDSQQIAKAYQASCTPDFYVFDSERRLVYRGQLDDSRPENGKPITGSDLRAALDAVLEGRPAAAEQKPSIGCNIKWKPGNEPAYFSATTV
jgi:thiol-disulfide isomerase/thioredoxin